MNNKFKMIALESEMGTADFDNGSYYVATPDKMQKFAESIVRECIQICEDGTSTQTTSNGAAMLIKQRFEIKEHDIQQD
jgi:hypothetical protein